MRVGRLLFGLQTQRQHEEEHPRLEAFAADEQTATVVLEEIKALRRRFNVYRGQALAFRVNEDGQPAIAFWE